MSRLNQRYYWLKLSRDFFKRHDIRIIEGMPNGKDYCLLYLKLLCESIDHAGNLRFSDELPYTPDMIATITNTNVDVVKSGMELFEHLKLMEVFDDGTIYMTELSEMTGSETGMAQYMRDRRRLENAKELGQFSNVRLTEDEITQLKDSYPSFWSKYIEKLSAHKESSGKEYASDYATLISWLTEDIGTHEEV